MKIYGSIHIHSCYKLTADMNNLHFMPGLKYDLWVDLSELNMTIISIFWPKNLIPEYEYWLLKN